MVEKAAANITAVGKRKRAIARATLVKGAGKLIINSKIPEANFGKIEVMKMREPFDVAGEDFSGYDINVRVSGGGVMGQAEAVRMAIAKGISKAKPDLYKKFMAYDRNMVVADPRRTEPHKPPRSSKGARRHKQRSKR